jgi:hypothetical protein
MWQDLRRTLCRCRIWTRWLLHVSASTAAVAAAAAAAATSSTKHQFSYVAQYGNEWCQHRPHHLWDGPTVPTRWCDYTPRWSLKEFISSDIIIFYTWIRRRDRIQTFHWISFRPGNSMPTKQNYSQYTNASRHSISPAELKSQHLAPNASHWQFGNHH